MIAAWVFVGVFALCVGGGLWFFLLGNGDSALEADDMRLEQYSGFVSLKNNQTPKDLVTGSRLVSGDNLTTQIQSRAYLSLDKAKLVVMDENTEIDVLKGGKNLGVDILQGTVFFNVTEALGPDELLEFRCNNVVTGVRGTSGVISYDPEAKVSQISVFTGSVVGTTATEEKTISAGEVGIITTKEDGTVDFVVIATEEKLSTYYSDDFVDTMQLSLNFEGNSFNLSELLRFSNKPKGIDLPDDILVAGSLKTLSLEQAAAFAEVIRQENYELVSFIDAGGSLAMIGGSTYSYNYTGSWVYDAVDPILYHWNGTSVENKGLIFSLMEENGEFYIINGMDTRGYGGVDPAVKYSYGFTDGMRNNAPNTVSITFWYNNEYSGPLSYITYDEMLTVTTEQAFLDHVYSTGLDFGSSIWKDGVWYLDTWDNPANITNEMTVYSYLTEKTSRTAWVNDLEVPTYTIWNDAQTVLTALEAE